MRIKSERAPGGSGQAAPLLAALEALAEQVDCKVLYAETPGRGGLAEYQGKKHLIINRSLDTMEKIEVLSGAMRKMDLQNHFMAPLLRKTIFGEEG